MFLYLLRHSDAQTDALIPDHDRALTPEGIASIQRVSDVLDRLQLQFDAVYSSPLLRARQTVEVALKLLQHRPAIQLTDHLKVGADFQKLFDLLNTHSANASVLLVGHEPYFSQLISTLLVGSFDAKVDVRKASLCCVETTYPVGPGTSMLKWLIPPHMMIR